MEWSGAKCRDLDPDIFFPVVKGGKTPEGYDPHQASGDKIRTTEEAEYEVARMICRGGDGAGECAIREQCLQYALDHYLEGVWGGFTTEGRKKKRKRMRRNVAA